MGVSVMIIKIILNSYNITVIDLRKEAEFIAG